jgi:PAS domain S-box-containing protein
MRTTSPKPPKAELSFEAVLEAAPDAMIVVDGNGRMLFVNTQAERLFDYTRTELIGRSVEQLVPERDRTTHVQHRERFLHTPSVRPMGAGLELYGRRRDGTEFPVEISLSPMDTPGGPGAIAAIRDISERQEAEVRFRGLLESAPDAIVIVDSHGRVVLVNAQAEKLFGYNRGALVGDTIEKLVPDRYRFGHVAHREKYLKTPSVRPMGAGLELYGRRQDGSEFPVEISLSPIESKHGTLVASAIRDISDRRKAEAERAQLYQEQAARREAERANRMKDEFLSVLSHELRTPLNAILGWAHLLRAGQLDASTQARAVETILRNAMAQTELISDILDLSRITSGKIHLTLRPVVLSKVVEAAVDSVRPAADAKGIRVGIVLDDGAARVTGDPDRLQQVAWNLLTNAVKFTPRRGRVTVKVERADAGVRLRVEDSGVGIDAEFLPHVFEAFRQADASAAREHGGLGLGLAIVRHLVELHDGRVGASSPGRGRGATFTVELPLAEDEGTSPLAGRPDAGEPLPEASLDSIPALRGIRLLVVEDERDGREMLETLLRRLGADVTAVADAEEAFDRVQSERPDVLVSDVGMPGQDGHSLLRRIRALPVERGGLTPAIALTAHARVEDRLKALASGFQHHVAKPVDPRELSTVIANVVGRVRFSDRSRE